MLFRSVVVGRGVKAVRSDVAGLNCKSSICNCNNWISAAPKLLQHPHGATVDYQAKGKKRTSLRIEEDAVRCGTMLNPMHGMARTRIIFFLPVLPTF